MKRPSRDACAALLRALDAYVENADKGLLEMMRKAGYAEPEKTLREIEALTAALDKTLTGQGRQIVDDLRDVVNLPFWQALKGKPSRMDMENQVNALFGLQKRDKYIQSIADDFKKSFRTLMPQLIDAYHGSIDDQLTTGRITKRTMDWMTNSWPKEVAKFIDQGIMSDLQRILQTSIDKGESVDKLTRRIMDSDIRNPEWKARRMALTEILRAHSYSQLEAYRTNPAVSGKRWMHTGAKFSDARENHVALNGTVVPVNALFTIPVSGEQCMCPRDTRLSPGESVNCHCLIQPVVDEKVLGLSLEKRQQLYDKAVADDDRAWEKELDRKNHDAADTRRGENAWDELPAKTRESIEKRFEHADITDDYKAVLSKRFSRGLPAAKKAYDEYVPKVTLGSSTTEDAHYSPSSDAVWLDVAEDTKGRSNEQPGTTFFHEFGHAIDCRSRTDSRYEYTSYQTDEFTNAIKADAKALEKAEKAAGRHSHVEDARWSISDKLRAIHGSGGIQDILGGVINKRYPGAQYGHSANYWRRDATKLPVEAFANMFEAAFDPDESALMEQYFPTAWKIFLEMLEDITK